MKSYIDGDIITFRAAFSAEDESEAFIACGRANTMVEEILTATGANEYVIYLSGKDNFRYNVFPEYKANRLDAKRPKWEREVKEHLLLEWNAVEVNGCEADDYLGWMATNDEKAIICTIDKDLDQIVGWHYNFVKKEKYYVTPAQGIYYFYYQLLVGDSADGIKGVPGIGPTKATRILGPMPVAGDAPEDLEAYEATLFEAVRESYGCDDAMEMNAKVLWIWKKEKDIWKWPNGVERSP